MDIRDELGRRILFFDGAMGTMLQAAGLPAGEIPERWNLTRPDVIREIHRAYLEAGCDIVLTNTFGASPVKLEGTGVETEDTVAAAARLARRAVEEAGRGWVALDVGPTGRLLRPTGDLPFEEAVSAFARQVRAGAAAGADLVLIETMSDLYELKAAVLAAKENCSLPVFATLIFDASGKLLTGGDIPAAVALLEGLGVDALGLNCGLGPEQMAKLLPELLRWTSLPVIITPNAGLPECVDGCTLFNVTPRGFAASMRGFAQAGAWMLGGCCGTTPEHIAEMVRACRDITPVPIAEKRRTWVSSYAKTVVFGDKPVLIGERINPTGKSRLKQALREGDLDYILREGVTQQRNGAMVLDVNVGLPDLDEGAVFARILPELQGVTDLPLQIDTADFSAMEQALRLYNGRPLINSVSGKQESMDAVFPLMKKYGGTVIALTLDESGIPAAAEGRMAVARRILSRAAEYGVPKEDIVFDPLAMTVSADQTAAVTTLETLRRIRDELGCRTSLGVSNISFGLPGRETVNAAFFLLAMQNGLSAAIMNPNSKAMMDAFYAYGALAGLDPNCADYIAHSGGETASAAPAPAAGGMGLADAVIHGLREAAVSAARAELETRAPMDLIDHEMIPALDLVGREFEAGRLYLPQLLMSAEAARAVFDLLKARMQADGGQQTVKGTVVLATVKGDVHDIGKNIVKVLLENYGYRVVDLGKDVDPEEVLAAVNREKARLVGLSALMTTTVTRMAETIRLLREKAPGCLVMVGGAVLTEDYARQIGADFYGSDAMSSVRYADRVFAAGT